MVQRQDAVDVHEEEQRGERKYAYTSSTADDEPLLVHHNVQDRLQDVGYDSAPFALVLLPCIAEMYITINRKTGVPSKVKMKHKGKWSTITVSNFPPKSLSNAIFTFNSKDYPTAEVIDLR